MGYYLKYKDSNVLWFDTISMSINIINKSLLPYSIQNMDESYDMIRQFCSCRILMMNREYCKEILTACGIDDQTDINICIVGRALSFRDNYWICRDDSSESWGSINLYQNKFSVEVQRVSLTGDMSVVNKYSTGDSLYTGELTAKGTRAKCYNRDKDNFIYLIKNEALTEIKSEIITYYIASALGLNCSSYMYKKIDNLDCSICRIYTSEINELIPCRDIMSFYKETSTSIQSNAYKTFYNIGRFNFIKMQLLDYIVLNTDRSRDNYGLLQQNERLIDLYPIFDHDSCFKGKSENGIYFPSGLSFAKTLDYLKSTYYNDLVSLRPQLISFDKYINANDFRDLFLRYKSLDEYNAILRRSKNILK